MTSGLFDVDGAADPELTGIESRTLRALLQLERRHVAILAETAGAGDTDTARVTQWERSRGRGYPHALVTRLRDIQRAVSEFSDDLRRKALEAGGDSLTILRPRGPGLIMTELQLPEVGIVFTPDQLTALDEGGGDFWQRLCDAAVVEAAQRLVWDDGRPVRVATDQAAEAAN